MRFFRALLATLFWAAAVLAAAPAFPQLYALGRQWVDYARLGEIPPTSVDVAASLTGIIPWLTLAGILAANATLVRILSKQERW